MVGYGHPTYFIAEVGINHNGDFFLAKRAVERAAKAGAHAVKFQRRAVQDLWVKEVRDLPQTRNELQGYTYGEYKAAAELKDDAFPKLMEFAGSFGIDFFVTPFEEKSVDFLETIDMPFYKISSFEITNIPLIEYIARLKKPIILSTGMATLEEVDEAVITVLKHHGNLLLMHCVSVYPSPDDVINLKTMVEFRDRYAPIPVGYSGHEQDILPSLAAVALGAPIVERHLTLSHNLPGPDHATVSLDPDQFAELVRDAGRVWRILGTGGKDLIDLEKPVRDKHAKSIVTKRRIPKGTIITRDMVTFKCPGYGFKPTETSLVVGKRAAIDIEDDTLIKREHIE
ncbi:hypothetical protein A2704_05045 [Candidatus Kaiserbacteria bacterium RIFCSPHIGHO2_01_FULL_54_36b]|uniref:AFP-like domain-containing protein n=1 Tax=Candidatus Kaiserbacteria bacterium RIFCSPHIGHO2_01_FULL_54_36b TaxID=1798483 RepID=A0A1F6CNI1_9BACT|nr:MAG: hypothetical protein A2704_05045 [Candidatus Kaiserbacteria bacterium RIFCSPHIGHO2_01_FULL_54_36b]